MARRSSALTAAYVGTTLGLAGCASHAPHPAPEDAAIRVDLAPAHLEPLPVVYRASGTVRGRNTAVLTSKTTGYVRSVLVRPGDWVTAGQPLVQLEANDVRASVARARAGLDQSTEVRAEAENALEAARAAATIAKSTYERAALLLKDTAIPQQQYDEAEARWRGAVAQEKMAQARLRSVSSGIEEAKAALGEAQVTLGYADIVAPFSGQVLERRVDPGTLASPGLPLLVVSDEEALRVEAAIEESYVDFVKIGADARVEIETLARPLVGKVGEVVPSVDVSSRAFLVRDQSPFRFWPAAHGDIRARELRHRNQDAARRPDDVPHDIRRARPRLRRGQWSCTTADDHAGRSERAVDRDPIRALGGGDPRGRTVGRAARRHSRLGSPMTTSVKLGAAGRLARAFIHSKLTPLLLVASVLLGAFAVWKLPREEEPQIIVPMCDVMVRMPGASARGGGSRASPSRSSGCSGRSPA